MMANEGSYPENARALAMNGAEVVYRASYPHPATGNEIFEIQSRARAHIGGHEIHIVIEGTSAALNFEDFVAGSRVRIRSTIHHFGPIHSQGACVFGIGAFICH